MRVAITGSEGLIGRHLRAALAGRSVDVVRIDKLLPADAGRVELGAARAASALRRRFARCDGVVHLGAVSRVVWGEHDPDLCWRVNVGGTRAVLDAAARCSRRPWVLFASSREVYGNAAQLPVKEDAMRQPLNVYARSKVAAEDLMLAARDTLRTGIVRLSSVYGDVLDHADRVVPAFACAAAQDGVLRVDGSDHLLDFTHALDVAEGLVRLIELLQRGESRLPPVHLVSGAGTTLQALAQLCCSAAGRAGRLKEAPPRDYDVSHFVGDPARARELLGWQATTSIQDGVRRLVAAFSALRDRPSPSAPLDAR